MKILEFFKLFVYTLAMQAFMPQKDTALDLATAARSFISAYNAAPQSKGQALFPHFPLYAFADELPEGGFSSCTISAPQQDGTNFFFPVRLACGKGGTSFDLRIVFAQLDRTGPAASQDLPQFHGSEKFPLHPRVFRTGRVEFKGDSWEVWDERWQKVTSP